MSITLTEDQKRNVLSSGYYAVAYNAKYDPEEHATMAMAACLYEIYEDAGNKNMGEAQDMAVELLDELVNKDGLLDATTGRRQPYEWPELKE